MSGLQLDSAVLGRLAPLFLHVDCGGRILSHGPLMARLAGRDLAGCDLLAVFDILRPARVRSWRDLLAVPVGTVHLRLSCVSGPVLRGPVLVLPDGTALLAPGFGIGVIDAVRDLSLTMADFGPGSLAMELLYLVEANAAVTGELRRLTMRLQGARAQAETSAATDPLTGLSNRRALHAALADMAGGRVPFGLLLIDLDRFKAVNDGLGHAAGDHLLIKVAGILRSIMRRGDVLARMGGDEFVVLLPRFDRGDRLLAVARRIIRGVSHPMLFEGHACNISASIGALCITGDRLPADPAELMLAADSALYAAKHDGRGRAVMADMDAAAAGPPHTPVSGTPTDGCARLPPGTMSAAPPKA